MALGFEKMFPGSLGAMWGDRSSPHENFMRIDIEKHGSSNSPFTIRLFGNAGREHMEKYGTKATHFGKVAEKNHRHSANNPYSQFRDIYSLD